MRLLLATIAMAIAACVVTGTARADSSMTFTADFSDEARFEAAVAAGGVMDIYASGEITESTADQLVAFVKAHRIQAGKVHLDSPGGSLLGGIRLGRVIRTLQFYTNVGAYNPTYNPKITAICASACVYAFAGGTSRFLDDHTGRLGVHRFYASGVTSVSGETAQQVSGLLVAYLDEMGVDAKAFALATVADRDGIVWLSSEMARELRLVNNGDEPPTAEIKLTGMQPYLRVEQVHYNVTARILFLCSNKNLRMAFGIVTDPESSAFFASTAKRSYLELDSREALIVAGTSGAEAQESVVWIERDLSPTSLLQLAQTRILEGWIDGSGAVRYGAGLNMPPVREKVVNFARQCYGL